WIAGVIALIAGAGLPLLMGTWTLPVAMGLLLAVWATASSVLQIAERLKTGMPPPSFWGMQLGHLGMAVFVVGVTLVGGYQDEKDVRMEPGDTVAVGGYNFRFVGVRSVPGPNYKAAQGEFDLLKGDRLERKLYPEKRSYFSSAMPMTEAAIDAGFTRDVYVSLGEPLAGDAWSVRVYYKPFVDWIWGGCLLMALGGVVAASDRRYRLKFKPAAGATVVLEGAPS
ncbi:MAG: cytochrome c-type biogenesis CcmF C-terminal domain-containing protein, partial [Rhodocyclaceae bacterium]|nr:cytochrome c-type biogenesis CcmF C-terminal domain-containing protein [Rhodocyclaceae bacterium]